MEALRTMTPVHAVGTKYIVYAMDTIDVREIVCAMHIMDTLEIVYAMDTWKLYEPPRPCMQWVVCVQRNAMDTIDPLETVYCI